MNLDLITADSVCDVLRAIRYAKSLRDTPLTDLVSVTLHLREQGVADTPHARVWALRRLLVETVCEELERLRGPHAPAPNGLLSPPAREIARMKADFQSGNIELEAWSLLYHRYLAVDSTPVAELADQLALAHRTLHRRLERGHRLLADQLRQRELSASSWAASLPGAPARDRVLVAEPSPSPALADANRDAVTAPQVFERLLAVVLSDRSVIQLCPEEVEAVMRHPAADWLEYRLERVVEWSRPRYRLDQRFVALTMLIDLGEESVQGRWRAKEKRYTDLYDVLAETEAPALVLLGAPGSGKSTLLRRLELDLAMDGLRQTGETISFFIQLNQYHGDSPTAEPPPPRAWLAERWAARFPRLPALEQLLAEGRMLLLLDALNEMPHAGFAEYRERVAAWKQLVQELAAEGRGNRIVFSCRSLDYSTPLSTPHLRVPQVQIAPMRDAQVRQFLSAYHPAMADALWSTLEGSPQLELVRVAYFARLLVELADATREVPLGRAAIFSAFVRRALKREIERGNALFHPDGLITERDYKRIASARRWRSPWELPERGALLPKLAELAQAMQATFMPGELAQARVGYDEALDILDHARGENIIAAGLALGVLDEDRDLDEVLFVHQLLQEYFAGRQLAKHPELERVQVEWRAARISPSLDEVIDGLDLAAPLPGLPQTGWEETTLMAAAMSVDPPAFLRGVMQTNLALAGRAAAQPELLPLWPEELLDTLRWALVRRSRDPEADLRDRIACGFAVGDLGDPRFERRIGPQGEYLLPPRVEIPDGRYAIGDAEPIEGPDGTWTDHMPRHLVEVARFAIGQFPVTNAEWRCFMASGGYDDERWWDTEAGRAWRRGENTAAGIHAGVRGFVARCRERPAIMDELLASGTWDQALYARGQQRLAMSAEELDAHLTELYPGGRHTEPAFWRDARFNRPAQPVVGVCWYEARAYLCWLSEQSGLAFRLPTEVEWEAAARGRKGRRFAYGDAFDRLRCNTIETHVRQVTPIGVFPGGESPEGVSDLTGNVFAWTSSAYGRLLDAAEYAYPYAADDGREAAEAAAEMQRVARGGSWYDVQSYATATHRSHDFPDFRDNGYGLRAVCTGGLSAPDSGR